MHGVQNTEKRLRHSNKRRCANIRPRSEAKHCSSLCSQSEGHEHVANIANALAHDFVGLLAVFVRHNIRPPHFASKVSYNAGAEEFVTKFRRQVANLMRDIAP